MEEEADPFLLVCLSFAVMIYLAEETALSKLSFPHCGGCNTFRRRRLWVPKKPTPFCSSVTVLGRQNGGVQTKPTVCFEISHLKQTQTSPDGSIGCHISRPKLAKVRIPVFEYRSLHSFLVMHTHASERPPSVMQRCQNAFLGREDESVKNA